MMRSTMLQTDKEEAEKEISHSDIIGSKTILKNTPHQRGQDYLMR